MRVKADTKDIDAFAAKIGKMPAAIGDAIAKVNQKTANGMMKRGRIIAPRSNHAPHIGDTIKVEAGDPRLFEQVVSVGSDALYYAVPLEFGHIAADGSHVPANPFWVPLTRIWKKKHRGSLRRALRKALKEAFPA